MLDGGYEQENIITPGQAANMLGQNILIGNLYKGSLVQLKQKTAKIKQIIDHWNPRHPLPQGRRVLANSLLTSQLGYLEVNAQWTENDLRAAQSLIDNFINKKRITSGGHKYLSTKDGGTSTPNLFLRSTATKLCFWKKS